MKPFRSAILFLSCALSPLLAIDAGLLQYAPADATEIAGISVNRAASSSLAADLIQRFGAGDVQEVVVASQKGRGLIAARGVFDRALLAGRLQELYNGVELYAGKRGSDLVAFPEATVALYGDAHVLKAALDRRGTVPVLDPVLSNKIAEIGSRYDAWFAAKATPGMKLGKARLPAEAVEFVSGGLTFGSVVRLDAEALMKTEKDAQSLVQMVKFFSSIGGSQMGKAQQLLQNAEARAEGATVVFSTSATEADLEQIFGMRKKTAALIQ